ncbi:outer membrane lipoprotein carrier protein LolA [Dactylosporangium sp. NPDC051541]|uniref:outer membrane lipoprotein carrier protein LolA n=1 Tax=Dactylosporangium sp. NPDC051541 TaxID=3363977 RepID=UPI00378C6441
MPNFTSRPVLRWAVPAVAAVAVVGAGVAAKTLAVAAEPDLPPRTAAQLLVDLQTAQLDGLSGTVVERADLGLPAIPLLTGDQSAKLTSLASGKHTLRVWYSGPDKARVSLLGTQGQSDIIHNGNDTWLWDSQAKEAQHFAGAPGGAGDKGAVPSPTDIPTSPQEAADLALKALDPTTQVSTGTSAKIAGRNAYELVLRPKDTASLVGEVRLAIDAQEKLPLRVQVLPRGSANPAFEVAFTSVNFTRPDDAEFKFNPPADTKVTEVNPDAKDAEQAKNKLDENGANADKPKSAVIGTGWTSVVVLRSSDATSGAATSEEQKKAQDAIGQLPTGNGGRTFNTKLLNVLFTDDGRVLIGSVTPERLAQVAADPAAALK